MITIVLDDDQEHFKVYEATDPDTVIDVTEFYQVWPVELDDGRVGHIVVRK